MLVKIKKLNKSAKLPRYAMPGDACFDLVATSKSFTYQDETQEIILAQYGTGLSIEIPEGYVGLLFPRSSVFKTQMTLSNSVGVIDSGYRGEIMVNYYPYDAVTFKPYKIGDRVGQMMIIPIPTIELIEAEELSDTKRASGGFGSTGV